MRDHPGGDGEGGVSGGAPPTSSRLHNLNNDCLDSLVSAPLFGSIGAPRNPVKGICVHHYEPLLKQVLKHLPCILPVGLFLPLRQSRVRHPQFLPPCQPLRGDGAYTSTQIDVLPVLCCRTFFPLFNTPVVFEVLFIFSFRDEYAARFFLNTNAVIGVNVPTAIQHNNIIKYLRMSMGINGQTRENLKTPHRRGYFVSLPTARSPITPDAASCTNRPAANTPS